jgi:hypothetical protein
MKPIKSLFIVLAMLVAIPGLAAAQGYYTTGPGYGPPPLPGGFHNRMGRLAWGFSLGLGYMNANSQAVSCTGCDTQPVTVEVDGHVGAFINPRLAIMLEVQGNIQQVALDVNNDTTLEQSLLLGAVQYWITPQLWVKGGIGLANLTLNDNVTGESASSGNGLGLLGGVGFELLSARRFSVDLQGRLTEGTYSTDTDRVNITSGTIGIGLNWY